MKIRAVRLKEVGRFSAPVALEGLTGGLDVLAGPNEFGKSTILKALRTALFEQHRSKHRKLEALRPYAGGAPLIEVDFEIGGRSWRIRKQFLSAPAAELRDLQSGSIARGVDAETRLTELLCGAGHFALLCVEQGTPVAALTPIETGGKSFMAAIESEVESVADGSAARFVEARVRDELAALLTSHNPPRPTGVLKAALDERDQLQRQLTEARRRLADAQDRLDRLEVLRARLSQLAHADAVQARNEKAADSRRAYERAREARGKAEAADKAIASCERERDALQAVLDAFDKSIDELARGEAAARDAAPLLADCEARVRDYEALTLEARQGRDAVRTALTVLERERRALDLSDRVCALAERLQVARAAHAERFEAMEALAGNAVEDKVVEAARREAASIAALQARLSAAAPRVSLAYAPGGAGKIRIDGRPLADGETLNPTRSLVLEIKGVGTLTITPGQSDDVARDETGLDAHRRQLASLLGRAGVASLEEAQARIVERREWEARLAEATARLKASAPEGLERLQRAHAELGAQLAAIGATAPASEEALEAHAHELMQAVGAAEEKLKACECEERAARDELADVRARASGHAERISKLTAELGVAEQRTAMRESKLVALGEAQSALNAAVREGAAWREQAPDDARLAELKLVMENAEAACARAQEEVAQLHRLEAGLEGELKSDRGDDVAARVDELSDLCARAEARCRDLQEEAGALQLLAQELDAAAARTRDRFTKPVVARLEPYLQLVLPQAQLILGEDLAPQSLQRGAASEELARLSDGTQEQLALIVRLAFARLLAEAGSPAPLILDDPLAYAGDERITRMFMALRHAAQSHQVLVLTCRERAFEELGGHRITLGTWEDARAAA